jgi:single-strand DNA-binding protein
MEITGRITADAIVKNLTDGRQLVSFDIAVNDYYRTRAGEKKQVANFFDCSYWITTKVAQYLTKDSIVAVYGNMGVYAYKDNEGNPQAALNFHVNNIRFIASPPKPKPDALAAVTTDVTPTPETKDDLPF